MSHDLKKSFEQWIDRGQPAGAITLLERVERDLEELETPLVTSRPIGRQARVRPAMVVVVAVFLTLFVVGAVGILSLLGGSDTDVIDAPPDPEITQPSAPSTLPQAATTLPQAATTLPQAATTLPPPIPTQGAVSLGNNALGSGPWVFSDAAGVPGAFVTWREVGTPPVPHVDVVECASADCSVATRARLDGLTGLQLSRPLVLPDGSWAWLSGEGSWAWGSGRELVSCSDSVCSETSPVTLADDGLGGDLALTYDGQPVFVPDLFPSPSGPLEFTLAVDDGQLAYAHRDPDSAALYLITCDDLDCASPVTVEVVPPISENNGSWAEVFSLAVGSDGLPVLAYGLIGGPRQLRVVHCENWACTENSDVPVSELHGYWSGPSLAIGSDGNPVMAFQSSDLITVLKCEDVACTRTTISQPLGETPGDPSLVIGSDGLPIIGYFPPVPSEEEGGPEPADGTELIGDDPVLFRCADLACTEPVIG